MISPIVYGELSILGYNGCIPNNERSGRRNKSKFLLCKRPTSNGIQKSKHYIVKQPQVTKAIQDRELHSISYTFSRSQTIIVEYKPDDTMDMFQIGRSSEEPIDFVVMDTLPAGCQTAGDYSSSHHHHHHNSNKHSSSSSSNHNRDSQVNHHHHMPIEANISNHQHNQVLATASDPLGVNRFHRHLAKVNEEMLHYGVPQVVAAQDSRNSRLHLHPGHNQAQALLNYPQPNISNYPPVIANHFRNQESSIFHHYFAHSSNSQQPPFLSSVRPTNLPTNSSQPNNGNQQDHTSSSSHRHSNHTNEQDKNHFNYKRSHATQSTISRFACRILVDREPPYKARIYAAGFDSSKNIFLGEKATKWEQNNSIDGLTTNGVLIMHPKRGFFQGETQDSSKIKTNNDTKKHDTDFDNNNKPSDINSGCSSVDLKHGDEDSERNSSAVSSNNDTEAVKGRNESYKDEEQTSRSPKDRNNISDTKMDTSFQTQESIPKNNNSDNLTDRNEEEQFEYGGVWREVSVDGGIYAIRESRSAIQKGTRVECETNILQDGTLIDLCGATLLWRSVDGFKSSPTKKSLEEKIDILNAMRPQCPVGLNTLIIPRKPILPNNSQYRHGRNYISSSGKEGEKNSHQPYVYLKCGHVQGYHDWGATKTNQRTCPICLSVGSVAKLSMGLEPSFYVDSGPLTHVFNPCGHMASYKTVKYWSSILIPHGTHFFLSICPFCASPLATNEPPTTKLIFQDLD